MIVEAAQGIGCVMVAALVAAPVAWKLMQSDALDLGHGFTDATARRRQWADAVRSKEPARLREGTR